MIDTGELTGLSKEWQQLLRESGISRMEQEKNHQALIDIVKFYQEGERDVWDKMGTVSAPYRDDTDSSPQPAQTVPPVLDRSTSQRLPSKSPVQNQPLSGSNTTKGSRLHGPTPAPTKDLQKSPASSSMNLPLREASKDREGTPPQPSAAATQLHKAAGTTTQKKWEKEDKARNYDVIRRLQQICTDADPTKLYRNLVKIGSG